MVVISTGAERNGEILFNDVFVEKKISRLHFTPLRFARNDKSNKLKLCYGKEFSDS